MNNLKTNLTNVAMNNEKICGNLANSRQKIQRLVGISRLLERVEFISKLPNKLRECLKNGKYGNAVGVWVKVERILISQNHFPSFKRIHEECLEIMEEIKNKIRGQMLSTDVSVSESIDNAVLLVKLNAQLGIVCSQLAHHRFLMIDNALEYETIPEEPFEALSKLKSIAIDEASTFVELYREKFLKMEDDKINNAKIKGILTDFMNNTFERI